MRRPTTTELRSVTAVVLWIGTAASLGSLAWSRVGTPANRPPLYPEAGSSLDQAAIEERFAIELSESHDSWLLIMTSSCAACLKLDAELAAARDAARCSAADLVPLVLEYAQSTDSIARVLSKHTLSIAGTSNPQAFEILSLRSVPAIIGLAPAGDVQFVWHPGHEKWPPEVEC